VRLQLPRLLVLVALVPVACGDQAATQGVRPDAAGIVWLCMPGQPNNPCEGDLSITVIDPAGNRTVESPTRATDPKIDCFYVYPTASRQQTINADLSVDPEERGAAVAQAALFSQVCRVYAPIYPQLTLAALGSDQISWANVQKAYDGVQAAFADYLANYNHGRGIVFIGHSQGAMLLITLLEREVEPMPEVRKLLVSGLLMGGNTTVAPGKMTGGAFSEIAACESASQTGCVVGYSSFGGEPPAGASFGRASGGLGMLRPPASDEQIMCVNPAAPGGKGTLLPIFPTAELATRAGAPTPLPATTYVSYPDELSAECKTSGDAAWLEVTPIGPGGRMPDYSGSEGPGWGMHDHDVSLTLGNLVALVRTEAAAYAG
jgi:hypothetical protein